MKVGEKMGDIWEPNKLILFLAFFIPGFISIKVYQLLIATETSDFSKSLAEAIGFSSLNYATFFWVIPFLHYHPLFYLQYPFIYYFGIFLIVLVTPLLWPFLYVEVSKLKIFRKHTIGPIKSAWDHQFGKKESYWVIVNLNTGDKIGGVYSENSFASAYPRKEQVLLEEEWIINNGKFIKKVPWTKGILIPCDAIKSIEFYNK
jgi:hypothetical protein